MRNGRCRLHGGKSTGPRTAEGRARCRAARWKHGLYCAEAVAERRRVRELLRNSADLLAEFKRRVEGVAEREEGLRRRDA